MNTLIIFAMLVAGTQAGNLLHAAPLAYAAAPIAAPVAVADPFITPLNTIYSSGLSASEVLGATGHAAILPNAVPFLNHGGIHNIAGAYSHHYAAPSYGYALRK